MTESVVAIAGQPSPYRPQFSSSQKQSEYGAGGTKAMRIPLSAIGTVFAALIAVILTLMGTIYFGLKGDIQDLQKTAKDTTKEIADTRIELTKAIGGVERQAVAANVRLDAILQELRQPRR